MKSAIKNFDVLPYDIDSFMKSLADGKGARPDQVFTKNHKSYFESYLHELSAKTIVVEHEYIDRDFLEDYSSYYVKCFNNYERKCKRIHLFGDAFTKRSVLNFLKGRSPNFDKKLRASYLGFLVAKPLPRTVIGRTCLKTYAETEGREFPAIRKYEANLFGICLSVYSLAYQEQDRVAAACATSALWSLFHKTGVLFQHPIPTPIEITKSASHNAFLKERFVPSNGLTLEQMAQAIREVELESFPVNAADEYSLQSTLYAYSKFGIPLALSIFLVDTSDPSDHKLFPNGGGHAVAITGFRLGRPQAQAIGPTGFLSRASRINKIYAHDDQVGPFARIELDGGIVEIGEAGRKEMYYSLGTTWKNMSGGPDGVRGIPGALLIPIYHKIRIPFETVQSIVINLDSLTNTLNLNHVLPLTQRLEWEIYLSSSNNFKRELLSDKLAPLESRAILLTKNMPRFIWRAIAYCGDDKLIEFIFDSTDIEQGNIFLTTLNHDSAFYQLLNISLKNVLNNTANKDYFSKPRNFPLKTLIECL